MDEPFTGVVYLEGSGVTTDFRSLKGKRIGYVGEFGKIQVSWSRSWASARLCTFRSVACMARPGGRACCFVMMAKAMRGRREEVGNVPAVGVGREQCTQP